MSIEGDRSAGKSLPTSLTIRENKGARTRGQRSVCRDGLGHLTRTPLFAELALATLVQNKRRHFPNLANIDLVGRVYHTKETRVYGLTTEDLNSDCIGITKNVLRTCSTSQTAEEDYPQSKIPQCELRSAYGLMYLSM